MVPRGRAIAQRIKATLGITGLFPLRDLIDGGLRCLDVGSAYPRAAEGAKGRTVRPLRSYVSWVQNVVRQFGLYLPDLLEQIICVACSTQGPE